MRSCVLCVVLMRGHKKAFFFFNSACSYQTFMWSCALNWFFFHRDFIFFILFHLVIFHPSSHMYFKVLIHSRGYNELRLKVLIYLSESLNLDHTKWQHNDVTYSPFQMGNSLTIVYITLSSPSKWHDLPPSDVAAGSVLLLLKRSVASHSFPSPLFSFWMKCSHTELRFAHSIFWVHIQSILAEGFYVWLSISSHNRGLVIICMFWSLSCSTCCFWFPLWLFDLPHLLPVFLPQWLLSFGTPIYLCI